MTYNPHFPYFVSPNVVDQTLGASSQWPGTPGLLLLDSFPPSSRPALLTQKRQNMLQGYGSSGARQRTALRLTLASACARRQDC